MTDKKPGGIHPNLIVIGVSVVLFGIIFVCSAVSPQGFIGGVNSVVYLLCDNLGWLVNVATLLCLVFALYFLFSKHGNIVLGGRDAKPEFKTFTWWGMSLCAGMGMGIVFWPPAEVIEYTFNPASGLGLTSGSEQALVWGQAQTLNHWVITLYAVYVAGGIIAAYLFHNMKQPFSISAMLYPLFGEKVYKYRSILDGIVTFAIVGGVAGSFGYGILQVSDGIGQLAGTGTDIVAWVLIACVIAVVYTLSAVSGLKKGIAWLGNNNAKLFILLLVFVAIFGPTVFSLNLGAQSTGNLLSHFFEYMLFTEPLEGVDKWSTWWNWLWYIDYFIFAPTTGFFLARLAKGRTLRQFIVVNFVAPGVFCMIWCWLFGGLAAHAQFTGAIDLWALIQTSGHEAVMTQLFDTMPLPQVMKVVMLVIVVVSFITLANAVISTVSKMSIRAPKDETEAKTGEESEEEDKDAPKGLQVFWGLLILGVALLFLVFGGLDGAKAVKLLVGFPIMLIMIVAVLGFWHMFVTNRYREAPDSDDTLTIQ